jgi:hypothetical protein
MSIDTRDKRASCLGIDGPYRFVLPNPDAGAEDQGDRQQVGFKYRGINAAAPGGVSILVLDRATWRRMTGGIWRRIG